MAWLQQDPSGNYHISFRLFKRSLRTSNEKDARTRLDRLEETIRLVEAGRIEIPTEIDLPRFLLSDGKLNGKPVVTQSLALQELFARISHLTPYVLARDLRQYLENKVFHAFHVNVTGEPDG